LDSSVCTFSRTHSSSSDEDIDIAMLLAAIAGFGTAFPAFFFGVRDALDFFGRPRPFFGGGCGSSSSSEPSRSIDLSTLGFDGEAEPSLVSTADRN
jgi:hypothetical protein